MSVPPVFFSYSSADEAFARSLATRLRSAGAHIWFDKFDIAPGTRWPEEIQKALKAAETVLIILSPKSVGSNNVMDELNYSLNKGKRIIPVLLAPCEVPYRIDNIQYVDFSGDEQAGFEALSKALGLKESLAVTKDDAVPESPKNAKPPPGRSRKQAPDKPVKNTTKIAEKEEAKAPASTTAKPLPRRSGTWITILLFAGCIGGFIYYKSEQRKQAVINLRLTTEHEFSAGKYETALLAATAFAETANDEDRATAILYRGKARIMAGIAKQDVPLVREGIDDLQQVENTFHQASGTTKYFIAIGYHYFADWQHTIANISQLLGSPLLRQMGYETLPAYNVYNLRGEAYLRQNNMEKACADFQQGMAANDEKASINFSNYCRVPNPAQPDNNSIKNFQLKGLKIRQTPKVQQQSAILHGLKPH